MHARVRDYAGRLVKPAVVIVAMLICYVSASAATSDVTRGQYLTRMADCEACHRGLDKTLSGGIAFRTPFGTIHATNITPDPNNGVGAYTDDQWVGALQRGVGRGGKHLYPAMPYTNYTLMSRQDALDIKAYIMTLPASSAVAPANDMRFPFNIRFLMVFWNLLYNPDHRFSPDGMHDAAWNRGAYLAEALGHCQQCHTPRNFLQGLKAGQSYAGALQQGWNSYNITPDAQTGIGAWSEQDISTYLASGHADGHGVAAGPMAEAVTYSLRYITPEDAAALAHYLKALPAVRTPEAPVTHLAQDEAGARVFEGACAGCHRANGTGAQSPYAALAGDPTASDPAGTNLLQVVLYGGGLTTKDGEMLMPGFARSYTDAELAAVANYTVAQFGGHAGQVTPQAVGKLRNHL